MTSVSWPNTDSLIQTFVDLRWTKSHELVVRTVDVYLSYN